MSQLSFADRENLLSAIVALGEEEIEVEKLLRDTGDWALNLEPIFGFEQILLRNLTQLSNYLRLHQGTEDIASIAAGAIKFITNDHTGGGESGHNTGERKREASEFHALGQAFIASYAVHEIAFRLGESVTYHPPAISKEEQALAEEIFERLSVADGSDSSLVAQVLDNLEELHNLSDCGFMKRLATNAKTLLDVLEDSKRSTDEKTYARGALRYFVENDDAIGDELGLVGYLDDVFILQMAVDLVSPLREPILELLDKAVSIWPFLNVLTIDEGSGARPASEFALLNAALTCRELRSSDAFNTLLIAPETGPIAILIGFISTLGMAHHAGSRQLTEESFFVGQKVLVDYEATALFDGFETTKDGRRIFWLLKYNETKGVKTRFRSSWPISDLHRLAPVDRTRVIRGEIERVKRNLMTNVSGLAFLFNGPFRADVQAIQKQVVVVMPTTLAKEFCKSTKLYGQSIKDSIPVGQVSLDGETLESWSTRFGKQSPALIFVSDLDVATVYAEENAENVELLVVDLAGPNREKHASLKRLNRLGIPSLWITSERVANETEVDNHNDISVWEWTPEDLSALSWPEPKLQLESGDIAKFEHRLRSTSSTRPNVELLKLPIVTRTYESFLAMRRLARQRGADSLLELEEIVSLSFFLITQLTRCSSPLSETTQNLSEIRLGIEKIEVLARSSHFLSENERFAIDRLKGCVCEFVEELQNCNPKAKKLDDLAKMHANAVIYCPDARLIPDLEIHLKDRRNRIVASLSDDCSLSGGLIVPGWFRQSRMASVLSPSISDPLILVLYDVEEDFYKQFSHKRRSMKGARSRLKGRAAIFPSMRGWKTPKPPDEVIVESESDIEEIEEIRSEIDYSFRQRIYARIQSTETDAEVKARLLLFAGGHYGLFTDNYRLNVVSHLLNGSIPDDDENATVKLAASKELQVGDAVVFRPKSRDLIREVADELLAPGQREKAERWQKLLRKYVEDHSLSTERICSLLNDAGCNSGPQAIHNWIYDESMIAPQQYRKDIPIIAEVIGDIDLANNMKATLDAIREVRSVHQQKAPREIARRIRKMAATVVRQEQEEHLMVQLKDDLMLLRVLEKASDLMPARYSSVNRIIEGESWHE